MKFLHAVAAAFSCVAALAPLFAANSGVARPQRIPLPSIPTAQAPRPTVDALPVHTELPDPLLLPDGKRIATVADWESHRDEVKQLLMYYATGLVPPAPSNVTGHVLSNRALLDGSVQYQLVHLAFGPNQQLGFDIAIFTPAGKGPFPTVIFPTFSQTPGAEPLPLLPRRPEQGQGLDSLALPLGIPAEFVRSKPVDPVDPEKFAVSNRDVFQRGYAVATYNYQDTGEDTIVRNTDGSWAFRNTRFFPAYPGYDWSLLAAWAWGMSRCADYLVTQDFVDRAALIVTGHSRIGKAVLIAGAFDERFAVSAPAGNGGGGVGAYRLSGFGRGGGEGLDDMERKYPNWFGPNQYPFAQYADKLPYDQHWFVALTAPRGFITLDGDADRICSVNGLLGSLRAASTVYALYGATDRIGFHFSQHGHAFTAEDWRALLDYADWRLRGKALERSFAVPPADVPKAALDVRKFGATGDGLTKDTAAFQRALDRCNSLGGGEVVVPEGDYLIGSIELRAHTTLRLERGAHLIGSSDIADYPVTRIRWEGQWEQGHRALISANDADQIAIVGPGLITGAASLGRLRNPRAPALIEPVHCDGLRFEGFTTTYASMWCLHPTRCANLTALDLAIHSGGGNGDGIDVDSCKNVRIERCDIDTGDDAIALKSGRGLEGFLAAEPTEDVFISHCIFGDSNWACIGIGSEASGGIRNVLIEHCTFTHAKTNAIYIKSRVGRGGVIENIEARDLDVLSSDGAFLRINLRESGKVGPDPVPGAEGVPLGRNFKFSNVRLANCGAVVEAVLTNSDKPVEGLSLVDISGSAKAGFALANLKGVELRDIKITGYKGPLLKTDNVTGSGLAELAGEMGEPSAPATGSETPKN